MASVWVEKMRQGDAEAFKQLFHAYCQPLITFAQRFVHDTQISENIVQEVFLRIWSARERLEPTSSIKSYLYTAVRNEALKHLRHMAVQRRSSERVRQTAPETTTPEDELVKGEIVAAVQQAVSQLPEKCRIIFSMNRYDCLTYREIAEIQSISIKTVEAQMSRALKLLRKRLAHLL
jgi:RNA polymerase sigma-70 factor (ECF subfamily)